MNFVFSNSFQTMTIRERHNVKSGHGGAARDCLFVLQRKRDFVRMTIDALRETKRHIMQKRLDKNLRPLQKIESNPTLKRRLLETGDVSVHPAFINIVDEVSISLSEMAEKRQQNTPIEEKKLAEGYEVRKAIRATEDILAADLKKEMKKGKSIKDIERDQPKKVQKAAAFLRQLLGPAFIVTPFPNKNEIVIRKKEVICDVEGCKEHEQEGRDITSQLKELKL